MSTMAITRRQFIVFGAAGVVVAGAAAVPIGLIVLDDDEGGRSVAEMFPTSRVASLSALVVGEPVMFDYPLVGQSNMLVKLGTPTALGVGPDSDVVAFSNICTHMGCPIIDYDAEHRVLGPCSCHYTTFDFAHDGQVVLGQATQKLPRVVLDVDGDDVSAIGLLRLVYGHQDSLVGAEPVAS